MDTTFYAKPETAAPEWQEFYQRLAGKHTAALWEVLAEIVPPQPQPACVPALWRFEELRPLLMEAGRRITAKDAERRVLMLENPGNPGQSRITQSLYAGLQLVLPGEVAPTHRHVASALRFVIESEGGYTAVDGERTTMRPGDFLLTPSWSYHDHGNPGDQPVIWLDGLDIPIVNFFDASFAQHYPGEVQPVTREEGDSLARYGGNLMPVECQASARSSPVFTYPYARSRETLERLYRHGPVDACHGVKLQFINPATGGYPLPTIGAFLQLLPAGFRGTPSRSTDATVYCAVEGSGRSRIGEVAFAWRKHDVFVAPSWYPVAHAAEADAVLFSFSDRPAQKALGFWREEAPISR
jgi:gentisate 1,2-dioxygenase